MACRTASLLKQTMSELEVAQVGKVVGLKGDLKLHDHSDFPEQFCAGAEFYTAQGTLLRISAYDPVKSHVRFFGYEDRAKASTLTNTFLFTTIEATKAQCTLREGEYFWFDIIGCALVEEEECLGRVEEIERIGGQDYLAVRTAQALVEKGHVETFLVPYVDRYVLHVNLETKTVTSKDARGLLESL